MPQTFLRPLAGARGWAQCAWAGRGPCACGQVGKTLQSPMAACRMLDWEQHRGRLPRPALELALGRMGVRPCNAVRAAALVG